MNEIEKWINLYDGLLLLVAVDLVTDADGGLSFPQKIDDEDCGEEVECCWKIPPHAGVEWPEELECVCCCDDDDDGGGGGGCCFDSF